MIILFQLFSVCRLKEFLKGRYVLTFFCISGASIPLSALRLLVPPIRLVSAAIWQTVEQKIVSDYGLLEEFVFMVTEIVPQILSTRQRAELILGLRARVRSAQTILPMI